MCWIPWVLLVLILGVFWFLSQGTQGRSGGDY
jgi:hypothetical protein